MQFSFSKTSFLTSPKFGKKNTILAQCDRRGQSDTLWGRRVNTKGHPNWMVGDFLFSEMMQWRWDLRQFERCSEPQVTESLFWLEPHEVAFVKRDSWHVPLRSVDEFGIIMTTDASLDHEHLTMMMLHLRWASKPDQWSTADRLWWFVMALEPYLLSTWSVVNFRRWRWSLDQVLDFWSVFDLTWGWWWPSWRWRLTADPAGLPLTLPLNQDFDPNEAWWACSFMKNDGLRLIWLIPRLNSISLMDHHDGICSNHDDVWLMIRWHWGCWCLLSCFEVKGCWRGHDCWENLISWCKRGWEQWL